MKKKKKKKRNKKKKKKWCSHLPTEEASHAKEENGQRNSSKDKCTEKIQSSGNLKVRKLKSRKYQMQLAKIGER